MSVIERSRLSPILPEEWQGKYTDLTIKTTESGHDYLYGIDKESDTPERLSWKPLDKAIEENFGYEPAEAFPGLRAENELLRQQNAVLVNRLDGLEQTLNEERQAHQQEVDALREEMAGMEERFNAKLQELETRLQGSSAQEGVIDASDFKEARRWQPQTGDVIPVREGGRENFLTIESISPDGETAKVRNKEGQLATMPLSQLARYWNAEQIRKRDEEVAVDDDRSLRGRFGGAYNRLIRKRTEVVPTAVVNDDGEVLVVQEEREVDNRRGVAAVLLGAAALVAAAIIGYEIGDSDDQPKITPNTITRTVPRPLSSNSIVIGKNRYKVLLNDEKKLAAEEKKLDAAKAKNAELSDTNSQLRDKVRDLRKGEESRENGGYHHETLGYYGDTVWSHAQRLLESKSGTKPDTGQVRKLTAKILRINGLRWQGGGYGVDAHQLPVGMELRIPNNIG